MRNRNRYLAWILFQATVLLAGATPSLAIPEVTPIPGQAVCAARFSPDDYVLDLRPYPSMRNASVSRMSKTGDMVVHYEHLNSGRYLATYYDFANAKFFTAETSHPTSKSLSAFKCTSICDISPYKASEALNDFDAYIAVVSNPNPAVSFDKFKAAVRGANDRARGYLAKFPGRQTFVNLTFRELGTQEGGVVAMANLASYDGCNDLGEVIGISDWRDKRYWSLDIKSKKLRFSNGTPTYVEFTNSPEFWKSFEESYALLYYLYNAKKAYLSKAPLLAYYLNADIAAAKKIMDKMDQFRVKNKPIE
jgi:hypothetical protein